VPSGRKELARDRLYKGVNENDTQLLCNSEEEDRIDRSTCVRLWAAIPPRVPRDYPTESDPTMLGPARAILAVQLSWWSGAV
jgi:hypothetical protein